MIANAEKQQHQNRRKKCQSENIEQTIVCQSERWTTNKPSLECNEKCKTKPFNYQKKILFLLQPHKINEKEKQKTLFFIFNSAIFAHQTKPTLFECQWSRFSTTNSSVHQSIIQYFISQLLKLKCQTWSFFFMLNHFVNHLFCEM